MTYTKAFDIRIEFEDNQYEDVKVIADDSKDAKVVFDMIFDDLEVKRWTGLVVFVNGDKNNAKIK